jgi:uncharacterized damage-inducible protein DinB
VSSYLDELFAHQEWADAEHWGAFESHSPALDDRAIRERLFHIHMVQHAFLYMTGPRTSQFVLNKMDDFPSATDLKKYGQQGLADLNSQLKAATAERLEHTIEIPWFKPPATISVRQALTQAAMHSHYHRGQNATRLRELGGIPPMTDFIAWLHKGKPAAQWE